MVLDLHPCHPSNAIFDIYDDMVAPLHYGIRQKPAWAKLTVREAAKYLGVSPQSVYLWVERKQIPHFRVMGRNIRFLKSDLETFRASFKQEMENA